MCQIVKGGDISGINGNFNEIRQNLNSCLLKWKRENVQDEAKIDSEWISRFLERESSFSLDFRSFGSSILDGARSKGVPHDKGYVWTTVWWSSDKSKR